MPIERPPVSIKGKNMVYAQPELVAEIEFRAWTADGKLRHSSFKGLRHKADVTDVFEMD
jgi:bifunctional non-homologous end joining protein LigD